MTRRDLLRGSLGLLCAPALALVPKAKPVPKAAPSVDQWISIPYPFHEPGEYVMFWDGTATMSVEYANERYSIQQGVPFNPTQLLNP